MEKFSAGLVLKTDVLKRNLLSARDVSRSTVREKGDRLLAWVKKTPLLVWFVFACAMALPQISHGQVSVWLQTPQAGQNPSQVTVTALAFSSDGISGWVIYVDDVPAYQNLSYSNYLQTTITIPNGRHLLYVRAWDATTSGTSRTLMIQVGPPPPNNPVLPTPPANAIVLTQMQNTTSDWTDCSLCAQGTTLGENLWMQPFNGQPSMSGSSRELFTAGLGWTNALFIKTMPPQTAAHFLWDFWIYQDPLSAANIWAAEFDLYQVLGGIETMMGSQCAFGDGVWDTWDSANNRWIQNGIPCPHWTPNVWHHIQWSVERVSDTQYQYNSLFVDGQGYEVNQVWTANPAVWPDVMGIQFQLDQSENGVPLHEWIDNVTLTFW